jgi:hypothetical protein
LSRVPHNPGSAWLRAGAALSGIAALLHLAVIAGGPDWYRFFGAGEDLARAAERGSLVPAAITMAIALVLALWAAFALSAAGHIRRLPLLRTAMVGISAVYLARGLLLIPVVLYVPYPEGAFDYWSSLVVLVYGLIHASGTWRAWGAMRPVRRGAA